MNNKVKIIAATLAVGMAATLAGCGGCFGCAGCGNNQTSKTLTRSNWFAGTSYNGIQPSFIDRGNDEENAKYHFSPEKITYDVTYDNTDAKNGFLELDYDNGTFTTEFYAKKYDWSNPGIPAGYAPENKKAETVYYYRTELTVSVKYTMKTGDKASKEFNDHVVTESYFRAAGKNLQPVYSKQVVKSTSPANYQPKTLEDAYKEIDTTYENFYDYSCTKILSLTYDKDGQETERKELDNLGKFKRTVFDNSSLYIVARSMKLSSALSESVELFSAAAGGIDEYAIVGSTTPLSEDANVLADYTSKLSAKGLHQGNGNVEATAVTVSYAGGNLHGTSQTIWYASVTDSKKDNNVSRATMLKLSIPISFSLGTLNYTLKEVNSTLWNG